MEFNVRNLNLYLFKNLPSAYFCGVRVYALEADYCTVRVKHRWFNQNPFRSMYFAVQNMGAELTTGVLVMKAIKESNQKIDRKSTRLNSSHVKISYAVFCLKKKKEENR